MGCCVQSGCLNFRGFFVNIGLDTSSILVYRNRGIGNYTINLYRNIIKNDKNNRYFFLNWSQTSLISFFDIKGNNFKECMLGEWQEWKPDRYKEDENEVKKIIKTFLRINKIDIFLIPALFNWRFPVFRKRWFGRVRLTGVVYDLTPYVLKNKYFFVEQDFNIYMNYVKALKEYDFLFATSNSTKYDVIKYGGVSERRITNVYADSQSNVQQSLDIKKVQRIKKKYQIEEKFLLFVGGTGINKNVPAVIKAFSVAQINNTKYNFQLVIVCSLSEKERIEWKGLIQKENLINKVILTGFISDPELDILYESASWAVFPSLYEGFGLPVLEAWRHGLPVMASNNSSVYEISKGAAVHVDPFNEESISKGFIKIMNMDEEERQRWIKRGEKRASYFSWEKTAKKIIRIFNMLGQRKRIIGRNFGKYSKSCKREGKVAGK